MIASEEAKKIALLSGEYRTYRKAERSKLWCWLFLLMLLLLIAFASLTLYYVLDQKTVGVSEVQAEDMPKHGRFEGGELEIVDYYSVQSVRGEEWNGDWSDTLSIEALHMLAYLENENGRFLIPVKIPRDAPIFKECIAALADPFRSNVRTEIRGTITALPNKLLHTLHETVRSGNAYYPAYDGLLDDIEIEYRTAAQTNSGPGPLEKRYFLMTAAAGLLGIFCYLMDKRSNGEKKSRKVQRQYDLRRGLVSDNIQGLSSER